MFEGKYERRRSALRAAIQMGGARVEPGQGVEDFVSAVAFLLSDEDACKCIALMFKESWPRAADSGAAPQAKVEALIDGYHGKDGR